MNSSWNSRSILYLLPDSLSAAYGFAGDEALPLRSRVSESNLIWQRCSICFRCEGSRPYVPLVTVSPRSS